VSPSFPGVATGQSSNYGECSFQIKHSFCCRVTTKWENDAHNMSSKFNVSSLAYYANAFGLCNTQSMFVYMQLSICTLLFTVWCTVQIPRAPSLVQLRPHWNVKKHLPSMSGYASVAIALHVLCMQVVFLQIRTSTTPCVCLVCIQSSQSAQSKCVLSAIACQCVKVHNMPSEVP